MQPLKPQTFDLKVDGISQEQLDVHFILYNGYVTNLNTLLEKKSEEKDPQRFSELTRRIGFEYNGIRLHEQYFSNLQANMQVGSKFKMLAAKSFNTFEDWKADFQRVTTIRGIGWGIVYYDHEADMLINTFVGDHEIGHLAGQKPVLVCDLWEHAFSVDFKPTERAKYLEVFWNNINWETVDSRL